MTRLNCAVKSTACTPLLGPNYSKLDWAFLAVTQTLPTHVIQMICMICMINSYFMIQIFQDR